jgi:phasin family protein
MYATTQPFIQLGKTNVAQAARLAAIAIDNAERLAKLNYSTAKSALVYGAEEAEAATSANDIQGYLALGTKGAEAALERAVGYSRNLYELAFAARTQYVQVAEEASASYTKGMAAWVEKMSKSAPAGSEAVVDAFKSTLAVSTAALDQFQRVSKEAAELADASIRAATANATRAAKKARAAA